MTSKGLENKITKFKDLLFLNNIFSLDKTFSSHLSMEGPLPVTTPSSQCFDFYICICIK